LGQKGGKGLICAARVPLYPVLGLMQSCDANLSRMVIGFIQLMGKPYDISFSNQLTVYAASSLQ